MGSNFTLFKNDSTGATPNDFEKDAFQDITLPATSNAGFNSTATTNPSNAFVVNSDVPRYGVKTLWIKNFELIEDRSRWIGNKETYKIIWTEEFAPVEGYAWGITVNGNGTVTDAGGVSPYNGMAVTGVIRKAKAIVGLGDPATASSVQVQILDTVDTVTSSLTNAAQNNMGRFSDDSVASNQTKDIHTFGIRVSTGTVNVIGFEVYFENATQDIDLFPGTSYVNKTKVTTLGVTSMPLASHGSSLGGNMLVYKTSGGGYSSILTTATMVQSIGQGLSGTNIVNVTTGEGVRFSTGDAITISGTTAYIGRIDSISTDALTVSPTLPFGYSNLIYRLWSNGVTQQIDTTLMEISAVIDFSNLNFKSSTTSISGVSHGTYYFDPQGRYNFFGNRAGWLDLSPAYKGIAFAGASAFLQIDGFFSAAEFIFFNNSASPMNTVYTCFANGLTAYSGATFFGGGYQKHTAINNAGVGWNSVRINAESSTLSLVSLSRVNLYRYKKNPGITFGNLAQMNTMQAQINRAHNASLFSLGMYRRVLADQIPFFTSNWVRGMSYSYAGGIQMVASTAGSSFVFNWFGKDFSIIGTQGTSYVFTIDGGATTVGFNVLNSVATLGHHKITYVHHAGTVSIQAIDYRRDVGEMLNLQKANAVKSTPRTGVYKIYVPGTVPISTSVAQHVAHANIKVTAIKARHTTQGTGNTSLYIFLYDESSTTSSRYLTGSDTLDVLTFGPSSGGIFPAQYAISTLSASNRIFVAKGSLLNLGVINAQTGHDGLEVYIEYEEL